MRLVEGDVLDADGGVVAVDIDDPVDHQERVAVRQKLHDAFDVERLQHVVGSSSIRSVSRGAGASVAPGDDVLAHPP